MTAKIEITVFGARALVNASAAKMFLSKEAAVNEAIALKKIAHTMSADQEMQAASKIFSKIQRLNRKIAKSGNTLQFI